jgi:hypothetical protein
MIIFDRLQISDDGSRLYIDTHVNQASYFDNIYIDKVVIQTQDQVSEADPLTPGDEFIYELTVGEDIKELHLSLNASTDFESVMSTLSDKLLFVYVVCKGTPDPCTPCRLDELTTLGVTFDETLFYQKVMQYTRQLADTCEIPKAFTDLILLWNGFKAAVETEHYVVAIDFWKKMFTANSVFTVTKPCGCHE